MFIRSGSAKEVLDICPAVDTLESLLNTPQSAPRAEAVLLVDDDDLYVRAMTRQLRSLGYPYVFRACCAAEALDMLQRVRPTIVLTDMVMEHREAGHRVIAAADQLGVAVAIVSGMPGLDGALSGRRFCRKSDLDATRLEQLVNDLVAETRSRKQTSFLSGSWAVQAVHQEPSAARKTA